MRTLPVVFFALALSTAMAGAGPVAGSPPIGQHSSPRGMLTPQERMLYRQQQRGPNWRSLSPAQRCEQKRQMKRQLASLSPAAMQSLKAQLDAQWNRLPAAQKQRIEQKIANHRTKRTQGPRERHARRCATAI